MRTAIAIVLLLAVTRSANAQPASAQAETLFRQGKELMAAGKIEQACAAFDASQKLEPTMPTLMNQANCREKNNQLATAWGLFLEAERQSRTVTDADGQGMHQVAADRAAKLEPRLSTLRVDVTDDGRIPGLEITRDAEVLDPATWNHALPIDGGTYKVSARAPGNSEWSTTVTVAAERDVKSIEIPKLRPAELVKSVAVESANMGGPETVWTQKRKIAIGVAGGSVMALTVGIILGVSAKAKQSDAHSLCPDPQLSCDDADRANDLVQSGHNLATAANVTFGIAATAAIGAGVLWFVGAPESARRVAILPAVSAGQAFVVASGSY